MLWKNDLVQLIFAFMLQHFSHNKPTLITKNLRFAKVELFPPRRLLQFGLSETVLLLVGLVELEAGLQLANQFLWVL